MSGKLVQLTFEVFGRVQGVNFRAYTSRTANALGLRGYCRNMASGTVKGVAQGPEAEIQRLREWLEKTGSPSSRITKLESSVSDIDEYTYEDFTILR